MPLFVCLPLVLSLPSLLTLLPKPYKTIFTAINCFQIFKDALPKSCSRLLPTLEHKEPGIATAYLPLAPLFKTTGSCFWHWCCWWRGYWGYASYSHLSPSLCLSAVPSRCLSRPWAHSSQWTGPSTNHTQLEYQHINRQQLPSCLCYTTKEKEMENVWVCICFVGV